MKKTIVAIRDVDEETFRKFRAMTVEERMKMGEGLSWAMKKMMKERRERKTKPDPTNLLKISGIIKTKKPVRWSEEIDEFLYGLEK